VLAAKAPSVHQALEKARELGLAYLMLDGKIVASDRCAEKTISKKGREIDRWYSGPVAPSGGISGMGAPRPRSMIHAWHNAVRPGRAGGDPDPGPGSANVGRAR
jgi:hypothetical protein